MFELIIYGRKAFNWIYRFFSRMATDTRLNFSELTTFYSAIEWYITPQAGLKFYNLYMFKVCQLFRNLSILSKIIIDTGLTIFRVNLEVSKTSVAKFDFYFFKQLTGTFPGEVPHRIISTFSSFVIFRQFRHIAFVHDVDKDWGTLDNREPQTLWLPIKLSLNFSQCYKFHKAIRSQNRKRETRINIRILLCRHSGIF